MQHSFVAYIDESGDDGIGNFRSVGNGGSSHWLTLAACVVSVNTDRLLPGYRDEIMANFPKKKKNELHFVNLEHEQRSLVCELVANLPLRFAAVMSNKTTIPHHPRKDLFSDKNTLYQYMCRYLIERISWYCKRKYDMVGNGDGTVKIIFSRRGGMSYDDFREYLRKLQKMQNRGELSHKIFWPAINIDAVDALDHRQRAGLQFSDVAASAFSAAVEPNRYGRFEPKYARLLASRVMMTADGHRFGFGVKPVPNIAQIDLHPEQRAFFDWYRKCVGRSLAPVPSPLLATATSR